MELPTYTSIWRIEKRLYKLYDFRLPMPLPVGQIAVFAAITIPYLVLLTVFGLPFNHTLFWLYVLPPGVLTWLATRPVLESKRLPELIISQVRYLGEPSSWCRMAPLEEKDEMIVVGRVWRRREAAPALAAQHPAAAQETAQRRAQQEQHARPAAWATASHATRARPVVRQQRAAPDPADRAVPPGMQPAIHGEPLRAVAADGQQVSHEHERAYPQHWPATPPPSAEAAAAPAVPGAPPAAPAFPPGVAPPGVAPGTSSSPVSPPEVRRATGPVVPRRPRWPAPPPGRPVTAAIAPPQPAPPEVPAAVPQAGPPAAALSGHAAPEEPEEPASPVAAEAPAPPADPGTQPRQDAASAPAGPAADQAPPAGAAPAEAPPAEAPPAEVVTPRQPPPVVIVAAQRMLGAAPDPAPPAPPRPAPPVERVLGGPGERRGLGWRGHVTLVPGGRGVNRPDPDKEARARATIPLAGPRLVAVLGCTVGAGQTVTTLMLADLLADLRGEPVAAVDLNPGPASLSELARTPATPVSVLVADAAAAAHPPGRGYPLRASRGRGRLDLICAGEAGTDEEMDRSLEYARLYGALTGRYALAFADPGASAVAGMLAVADQLVLVAPASPDAARAVGMTLEWLAAHGYDGLRARSVMVLNGVSQRSMPHAEQAEHIVSGRCRAIVRVPWDDHLAEPETERGIRESMETPGTPPRIGQLRPAVQQAYTALAGVLVTAVADSPQRQRAAR